MKRNFKYFLFQVFTGYLLFYFLLPHAVFAEVLNTGVRSITTTNSSKTITNLNEQRELDGLRDPGLMLGGGAPTGFAGFGQVGMQTISVHVLGDVKSPGVYSAMLSQRAASILQTAGLNRLSTRVIQIRNPGEPTRYYDLYQYYYFGNLEQNPFLKDNDVIFVPDESGAVRIEGPVKRPAIYELNGEKSLYQIVRLSGGFTKGLSSMHPMKVIRFDESGKKYVLDVIHDTTTLKKFKIEKGDIYIVPDKINANKLFDYSVETIPGENIVYPTSVPDVFVIGAVNSPGPYPYKSHLTVKDYLGYAGATATSNFRHVTVFRNGKRKRKKLYDQIYAGDVVIVKERGLNEFFKYLGIASTIMSFTLSAIVFKDVIRNQ